LGFFPPRYYILYLYQYPSPIGIILDYSVSHLKNESIPNDEFFDHVRYSLFDTNLISEYSSIINGQLSHDYISPDAAKFEVTDSFVVLPPYNFSSNFQVLDDQITDDEVARYQIILEDLVPRDTLLLEISDLTLGEIIFETQNCSIVGDRIEIHDANQASIDISIHPLEIGEEIFSIQMTSTLTNQIQAHQATVLIEDDDILAPEISNLELFVGSQGLFIELTVTDQSGIDEITLFIDNNITSPSLLIQNGSIYQIEVSNLSLSIGEHELRIQIRDGDNDRENDSMTSEIIELFTYSHSEGPEFLLQEILDKIIELKNSIPDDLHQFIKKKLIKQLNLAMLDVQGAIIACNDSILSRSVILTKLARTHLTISNIFIEISNWLGFIEEEFSNNFINSTREIRNDLIFVMGEIIGTELAQRFVGIEVNLLTLVDEIHDSLSFIPGGLINIHIKQACEKLDQILIKLSQENYHGINRLVRNVKSNLRQAKLTIKLWKWLGIISDDVADHYIFEINNNIAILNSITVP